MNLTMESIEKIKTLAEAIKACGGDANAVSGLKFYLKSKVRGEELRKSNSALLRAAKEAIAAGTLKVKA